MRIVVSLLVVVLGGYVLAVVGTSFGWPTWGHVVSGSLWGITVAAVEVFTQKPE